MNKILTVALGAALVAASASASAADANGSFFINAGVGQAQYHVGHTDGLGYKLDDKDTAGALRFGYAWKVGNGFDLGVEGGYVDLGKLVAKYHGENEDASLIVNEKADIEASGWVLGANGKYAFGNKWFVSARAGWFRSTADASYRYEEIYADAPDYREYASGDADGNGWYGGVGVGYDFAPNFSLGLNYDNYHGKAKTDLGSIDGNIGVYTVTAEFRF
ncbi:outer membrane beta-barrel protein [Frateuria sp. GZRe14]|uniref:outer membrane beta-barrel protein n=1 Tax=Frateuria sp. GZRe14 TaxID=3351534 RepID=UPI003EDBC1A5